MIDGKAKHSPTNDWDTGACRARMWKISYILHTAVAWQTVNELACGDSGIVHGAKCIAVLNGVA